MFKHLKVASLLFCISLLFLLWGGYQNVHRVLSMSRGNYFFEKTRDSSTVASFRLLFPDNTMITLEKKEKFWRIKEADGYYVDFAKINSFMKLIFQTTVYRADYIDSDKLSLLMKDALSITVKDTQGQILDTVFIAPKNEHNKFHYATTDKKTFLYQINGSFDLSPFFADWIQSPLLAIPYNEIKFINTNEFYAYRRYPSDDLKLEKSAKNLPQLQNLTDTLWYLSAIDVKHAVHFKSADYPNRKKYEITTFNGLIYELNLFYNDNEYWVSIMPRAASLLSNQAQKFLEENLILYDGWFFRLTPNIGETLANFSI